MTSPWLETWHEMWTLLLHGGWVMVAIFLVGQLGWFLICERWWHYRQMHGHAERFWKRHGSYRDASLAQSVIRDPVAAGLLGQMIQSLVAAKDNGREGMVTQARELLAYQVPKLNRHLNTLAVLAGTAPLLGLAGTVVGIMQTFRAITLYGAGDPSLLAGGIAQALMVTEAGLVVAFPLLLGHNYLQNRADHIEAENVEAATRLIHAFETAAAQTGRA
jgi:biopolymer transport protein ExbB